MQIYIDLLETDAQIERSILKAIAAAFNDRVILKKSSIRDKVANLVGQFITATPTYQSLMSGELAGHFGLPISDRSSRLNNIITTIKNNVEVEHKPVRYAGSKFLNGVNIGILIKNFTDILALSEAVVTTSKGQSLPWLEWLLLSGNRIIISEHDVSFVGGEGRSGMAIMVKNNTGVWRVPPQYAGTLNNNWLTRTFIDNQNLFIDQINQILKNELQ